MAYLVGGLLLVEAAMTAMWVARMVPRLDIYGLLVALFVVLRAGVAALQGAAGVMTFGGRPAAALFGQRALLLSAGLLTFELGARVTPTSVFPAWRWPIIGGYWVYALAAIWVLERSARR